MMRMILAWTALALAVPAVCRAQAMLTLQDAMLRARTTTPAVRALDAASAEARERVREARAGYWPRVDVSESVQRTNQPPVAFSALLSQRRFTAADFAIDRLNHPDAVTNIRTTVSVEQPIYDAGLTGLQVRAAELGRDISALQRTSGAQDLALAAARAFVGVLRLEADTRAVTAAVASAQSDLDRVRARRDAGMVTAADVLALEVHLADMRRRQITSAGELDIARLELREAIGLPFDAPLGLVPPVAPPPPQDVPALVREALVSRPEWRQAQLRVDIAMTQRQIAKAAFLPRISVHAGADVNSPNLGDQRAGWIVGAQAQVGVFDGFGDQARLAQARHATNRVAAEREALERRLEVEVRAAAARLEAARSRDSVGRAALAQAQESQRIIRDRYDAGLATVTDVLRAAEAALDAEAQAAAAELDVILHAAALDRAIGRL